MYTSIYAPLDNSDHSNTAMRYAVELGRRFEARVTGSHVYAAALHDVRFKQMEFTLPDEYKEENELEKQRRIHDALITRGLQLISDSYLAAMYAMAEEAGVELEGKTFDGKNFEEIAKDIGSSDYDLVILGALGLGAVKQSSVGSVCERVLRRSDRDTLVIRDPLAVDMEGSGSIVLALDGSAGSWGGLKVACGFAKLTGRDLEIVAVHTPDSGSEALLDAHVSLARQVVRSRGLKARTTTLEGHAAEAIAEHLNASDAWLLVVGRHGLDVNNAAPEIGAVTEGVVRLSPINVLVTASPWRPELEAGQSQEAA